MIKGIILDIDGVIIGEKEDYNFPYPHESVIERLKSIEASGIPISVCTAKASYSTNKIIELAQLKNLHITENGAVLIDPLDNIILKAHFIDKDIAKQVVKTYIDNDAYTEIYKLDEYIIQDYNQPELTKVHTEILQKEPRVVNSLVDEISSQSIVKIMPIAKNEKDKERLTKIFEPFKGKITLSWGVHPVASPRYFGIITAKGISKKQAVMEIAEYSGINPEEFLGVGDSTSDWQFIEQCGYAGAVGNASQELKNLIATKGDKSFVGGTVDKNGVLDIFNYFKL